VATKKPKKPITDQIATAQNDITMNYIGKTLLNPDKVLKSEGGWSGVELYEDMLFEARVASEMQKRRLAVIGKEWDIIPASDDAQDQKIAEFVEEVFKNFSHDRSRQALLTGIITGFKPGEIMWEYSEGDIWIKDIKGVSPRRFVFDLDGNLRLLTYQNMLEGIEIPERKFMVFTNPSNNGSPYGDALGRALYWPIWFKKNGVKFWAVFLDKFGQPTPWGKYPSGTDEAMQNKLLDSLKAMQTDQAIITPDTMTVELLEAARASSVDSYDRWEKFWNDAITFIILGQSATTEGTPGKLGAETERADVRQEIVKADADLLCECQNEQLIKWLVDYNFPVGNGLAPPQRGFCPGGKPFRAKYPKIWIRTDPEQDLKPLAERDRILIKEIGVPTPVSYIRDTYGIPEPEEGEELISVPQTPNPFGQPAAFPAFAEKIEGRRQKAPASRGSKNQGHFPIFNVVKNPMRKIGRCPQFAEQDWVSWYMSQLSPSLKKVKASALADIETWLRSQGSPPSEDVFISKVQGILGDAYKNIDKVAVADAVTGIYQTFKGIEAAVGFGGADIRAINFLGNLDHFYLSKFIENPDAQSALTNFLKERYLQGGEGLFGRGDPKTIAEMKNLLAQHMTDLEGYQINRIVDTAVVRVQNWAHISQLHEAAIAEIRVIEAPGCCPFCEAMDGKVIQVDVAYQMMMDQAGMTEEEYQDFLRDNPPSLDGIEDFVNRGMLPPYHPHCRGDIVKRIV